MMHDIIFLSYDEPNADQNWECLSGRFPLARRVHGIEGIAPAHKEAARQSRTEYFWVVDGDNQVEDDFDFDFAWDRHYHLNGSELPTGFWKSRNSVNGLKYGYGGIKLLPRSSTLKLPDAGLIDITTSISQHQFHFDRIASTTVIDATPRQAFRAGLREASKLAMQLSGVLPMSDSEELVKKRLNIWCHKLYFGHYRPNGKYCVDGAIYGVNYCRLHRDYPDVIHNINDFEWLDAQYDHYTNRN